MRTISFILLLLVFVMVQRTLSQGKWNITDFKQVSPWFFCNFNDWWQFPIQRWHLNLLSENLWDKSSSRLSEKLLQRRQFIMHSKCSCVSLKNWPCGLIIWQTACYFTVNLLCFTTLNIFSWMIIFTKEQVNERMNIIFTYTVSLFFFQKIYNIFREKNLCQPNESVDKDQHGLSGWKELGAQTINLKSPTPLIGT